ncbi:hypothetical protein KKA50_00530 [Patescibacteria group bacterium]|nr:hypothetical protein [Patescibacteria group bacterium]
MDTNPSLEKENAQSKVPINPYFQPSQKDLVATPEVTEEVTPEIVDLPSVETVRMPTLDDKSEEPSALINSLPNIALDQKNNASSNVKDPKDLDLKMLGSDEHGLYIKIPTEINAEVRDAQNEFIPVFMDVHKKYANYPEWEYMNAQNPFVFAPATIRIMSNQLIPQLLKETTTLFSNGVEENTERSMHWKESNIEGILNKLLAYESYRLERIMAPRARDHMKEAFPGEEVIKVKELCTGAGMTTALMYEALKETGKKVEFHSADNSLQSVICAATLLTLRGIPTRIVLESGQKEKNFEGVTIYFETAQESIQKNQDNYHFVFSDNGINYFDEKPHFEVVDEMVKRVKPGGLFQDCTLDPGMQVDLSTVSMLGTILFTKKENFKKKVRLGDAEYSIKEKDGISFIEQLFSPSSTMQYELLADVGKKLGVKAFAEYLGGAKKAGAITKKLAPKIAQDLRKTGMKILELTGLKGSYYPTYEDRKTSLTRFFELKLPKNNDMG